MNNYDLLKSFIQNKNIGLTVVGPPSNRWLMALWTI